MPCWELFDEQSADYRRSVFPQGTPVIAVEAASPAVRPLPAHRGEEEEMPCAHRLPATPRQGWSKYAHTTVTMNSFGASGPAKELHKKFGFTVDSVAARAREAMAFFKGGEVPWLMNLP